MTVLNQRNSLFFVEFTKGVRFNEETQQKNFLS